MHVQGLDDGRTSRVLFPGSCVLQDRWHPGVELRDDSFAKTAVNLWALLVEYADSKIDDGQDVMDEWQAVDEGFSDLCLDLLEIVL